MPGVVLKILVDEIERGRTEVTRQATSKESRLFYTSGGKTRKIATFRKLSIRNNEPLTVH